MLNTINVMCSNYSETYIFGRSKKKQEFKKMYETDKHILINKRNNVVYLGETCFPGFNLPFIKGIVQINEDKVKWIK